MHFHPYSFYFSTPCVSVVLLWLCHERLGCISLLCAIITGIQSPCWHLINAQSVICPPLSLQRHLDAKQWIQSCYQKSSSYAEAAILFCKSRWGSTVKQYFCRFLKSVKKFPPHVQASSINPALLSTSHLIPKIPWPSLITIDCDSIIESHNQQEIKRKNL